MPHVSKHALAQKVISELENRITTIISDTGPKSRAKIFKEVLTKTERMMIAKRLTMIYLVQKGTATHQISEMLKVSPSTVARFEVKLERGYFKHTASWLKKYSGIDKVLKLILDLAAIPFEAQKKFFGQMIDEN